MDQPSSQGATQLLPVENELLKSFQLSIRHIFHFDNLIMHDREPWRIYQGFALTFQKLAEIALMSFVGLSNLLQGRSQAISCARSSAG